MFTWICPKCGKEVPPSYSECPNCSAAHQSAAAQPPAANTPAAEPPAPIPSAVAPPAPVAVAAAPRSNRVAVPGWMLSLLFAAVLIIIGLTVIVVRNSSRSAPPPPAAAAPLENPSAGTAAAANPALRNLELSGLRLTEDNDRKAFVQVVAINHSQADLGEITVKVSLKAVARQTQEPVGTFSFKTTLGPYEAKDVKAPIETKLRVYELPDWQFLRAEILP